MKELQGSSNFTVESLIAELAEINLQQTNRTLYTFVSKDMCTKATQNMKLKDGPHDWGINILFIGERVIGNIDIFRWGVTQF